MRRQWKGFLAGMLVTAMALGMVNSTAAMKAPIHTYAAIVDISLWA